MSEYRWVYVEIVKTSFKIMEIGRWMQSKGDALDEKTSMFLGAAIMQVAQHANITTDIINNPDVQQPIRGRCIFY